MRLLKRVVKKSEVTHAQGSATTEVAPFYGP